MILAVVVSLPAAAQSESELRAEVSALEKRVAQLEGQLVDLQVIIGTLESLARNPAAGSNGGGGGGFDNARLAALETQVNALAAQLSQPGAGNLRGAATPQTRGFEARTIDRGSIRGAPEFGNGFGSGSDVTGGFGSTVVSPGGGDRSVASLESPGAGGTGGFGDPKQDYETAYGLLLQQNYAAAKQGFDGFLAANPRHSLAGNAQYWLGEIEYVQGNYREAAQAFLKGYQTYSRSSKAPDSLLKLAISLDRLGARDDACNSFGELLSRFPRAPDYIRQRATAERGRLGC